jgi:hypothetical protein
MPSVSSCIRVSKSIPISRGRVDEKRHDDNCSLASHTTQRGEGGEEVEAHLTRRLFLLLESVMSLVSKECLVQNWKP